MKVNQDKSDDFDQNEYLNLPQDEGVMNGLSEKFDDLTKPLWQTNSDITQQLFTKKASGGPWLAYTEIIDTPSDTILSPIV